MAILAGVDEAGLGPRLGPLVAGLAVFRGPREVLARLPEALAPVVGAGARAPVPVGDSKRLYGSGKSIEVLERGVYPFLRLGRGADPRSLAEWLEVLGLPGGPEAAATDPLPWYRAPLPLPRALDPATLDEGSAALARVLAAAEVEVVEMRAVVLAESAVNRGLSRWGSKSVLNFEATAPLLRRVFDAGAVPGEEIELVVDRQGGRKDYSGLLRPLFHPAVVSLRAAGADTSAYTVQEGDRQMGIRFVTRADRTFLPVGLASMIAKYTRELHMTLLNRYWQARRPGLRPTAGYPTDAGRFLREIEPLRVAAGIDVSRLVRRR